jgi:hypothetical protein
LAARIPKIYNDLSDEDKDDSQAEYEELLPLFINLVKSLRDPDNKKQALLDLARLKAQLAISHAFEGFDIEQDEAIRLINQTGDLSELDEEKKKRLIAAINNLIEFSVCEEYQLMTNIYKTLPDFDFDSDEFDADNEEAMEPLEELNKKYNLIYAGVENMDIEYAMMIALAWISSGKEATLTYMTQNDDRVRPWHFALQGFSAKKDDFPSWMIPPIEWGCRCFLVDSNGDSVINQLDLHVFAKAPKKPKQIDDVFSESVAKCGRIFGKSHSYFKVGDKDKDALKEMVELIKQDYYA